MNFISTLIRIENGIKEFSTHCDPVVSNDEAETITHVSTEYIYKVMCATFVVVNNGIQLFVKSLKSKM